MLAEQITIPTWVSVPTDIRRKLRELFFIPATGNTEVVNDEFGRARVLCDGCTNEDLKAITVAKLQDYLGSVAVDESLHELFRQAVEKAGTAPAPARRTVKAPPTAETTYTCPKCPYQTANKRAFTAHKNFKHRKTPHG